LKLKEMLEATGRIDSAVVWSIKDGSSGLWAIGYQQRSRVRSSSKQPRVGSGSGNL
jgi:hypothetical protein